MASAMHPWPVMAGPFEAADFMKLVPPDKKLRPEWVRSLFARGEPAVYTKSRGELRYIGMPVGGLCCGTLYLGGDGRLWCWDIFNENKEGVLPRTVKWKGFGGPRDVSPRDGASYVEPHEQQSPLAQGFALRADGGAARPMDTHGWKEIAFRGEYPLGRVTYSDPALPVGVTLTAYSPFIPLNADDSGLPATICEFALTNESEKPVTVELAGWLENAGSLFSARPGSGRRVNTVRQIADATIILSHFDPTPPERPADARPDIVVNDFERPDYGAWKTTGTAFGTGPIEIAKIPDYQGDVSGEGKRVVNSHSSAPGKTSDERDKATGTLTSPPFVIERPYLTFLIGGGKKIEEVGLRLRVDGKVVRQAAGHDENRMRREVLDVREFAGKQAVIEIEDKGTGGWGNVGVDQIVQTDAPWGEPPAPTDYDFGTLALAVLGGGDGHAQADPKDIFAAPVAPTAQSRVEEKLIGAVTKAVHLAPGATQTVTFVVAWHFPNSGISGPPDAKTGNYYAKRFPDASIVAAYVARQYPRLSRQTKLWHETWYDSTLPHWFLNRTFVNTSTLATTTSHRFGTGRFWGWEGVGCCEGTCTHVWHYAQAVGRLFPELERYTREHVDFGAALDAKTGQIGFRGEGTGPAVDGQAGSLLRALREHQMSADDKFLRRLWPKIRLAMDFLIHHDANSDGLLDGAQANTLDADWYGEIPWLSSLYGAALRACETMATEMDDPAAAKRYGDKYRQARHAVESHLFNGEYFIQKPGPDHDKSLGTYHGCEIDQVFGQSWAWQIGLGRVLDRHKTVSALQALYKYNFAPDVGPFRKKFTTGRPYALAGEGGLLMATNPQWRRDAYGGTSDWQGGYFNECMSGFEHQAASHMIAEGLLLEGLTVTRAIHDRYHPRKRNPYNEIECSDHYARAMASYGSFVSLCGFEYHGPKGHLGFAPRLRPEDFRAAFTAAEGWGTFAQRRTGPRLTAEVRLRYGRLRLNTLALTGTFSQVAVKRGAESVPATVAMSEGRPIVTFPHGVVLKAGQTLSLSLT